MRARLGAMLKPACLRGHRRVRAALEAKQSVFKSGLAGMNDLDEMGHFTSLHLGHYQSATVERFNESCTTLMKLTKSI